MNKHGAIGVVELETGVITICAAGDPGGSYDTLCGTSISDDLFKEISIADNKRIDCVDCKRVWALAKSFVKDDFVETKSKKV